VHHVGVIVQWHRDGTPMATPCSVKAWGRYLRCWPRPAFKVTACDLRAAHSEAVSWNMKARGNRARFRLTARTRMVPLTCSTVTGGLRLATAVVTAAPPPTEHGVGTHPSKSFLVAWRHQVSQLARTAPAEFLPVLGTNS
jgi:hypothetical protein